MEMTAIITITAILLMIVLSALVEFRNIYKPPNKERKSIMIGEKVMITHSFAHEGGKYCGKCKHLDGFIGKCRVFGESLIEDETSGFAHERCDKCVAASVPVEVNGKGGEDE